MTIPREVRSLALLAAATASAGMCAAQSAAATQAVDVTGSRLRGTEAESTSPIQVITAEEIQRRGVGSLRELLVQLSSNSSGTVDIGGASTFAPGASGTGMRGLGMQSTLVLLNSRRVAPYPLANFAEIFTNIDALPFEAIDRVEVLKIGGAALYGSDAMSGVINIITRRDWVGVKARVSHERSTLSGRFGNTTASVTAGFGAPGADSGHLMVNLELYRRDALMYRDVLQYSDPTLTSRSPGFGSFSSYSWPGNVIGAGPVPGCAPELIQGGLCRLDRYARFEAIPAAARANLLVTGQLPVAQGRRLFGELLLADTRTDYRAPFQAYGPSLSPVTWGDPANNTTQTFFYRGLPAGHPLNVNRTEGAELRYRFIDGPNEESARTLQYRASAGLAGAWRGFDWEAATGLMGGSTQHEQRGWYSVKGFREVIGIDDPSKPDPLFLNRAYRIGQTNSPEVLAKLFPNYGYAGHVQQWFVDGKLSGAVINSPLSPSGPLNLAVGAELRHERFTIKPSANLLAGDIVGNGLSASDAARTVGSAYAEAAAKVNAVTEVQAALRADQYTGLSTHFTPKLALRIKPAPQWLLRATAETGFRAPNLTESADSTKFSSESVGDPKRCPQARALADELRTAAGRLPASDPQSTLLNARADNLTTIECLGASAKVVRNNPDLKPESSRSLNAGVVFSPSKAWRLSVDAWDIRRRNEIGLKGTSELLSAEAIQPAGTINRFPIANDSSFSAAERQKYGVTVGLLQSVVGRFENIARTHTQGVDVAGEATTSSPIGAITLQMDASYLTIYRAWSPTRGDWGDNLAGRNGHSRWKLTHSATLKRGAWEHTLQGISYSAMPLRGDFFDTTFTDQACADAGYSKRDCTIPGYTRWTYGLRFTGLKHVTVGVSVGNVFGTVSPKPVASWLNNGGIFPPSSDDARGRTARVTVEWRAD